MNVLILSCGTRCLLVEYFRQRENGFEKVVATDCSPYSPALYCADKFYIVSRMKDPNYLPTLFEICECENINVVIPLQEDELILIAGHRKEFEDKGILPVVSDIEFVNMCRDKYKFYQKMTALSLPVVPTYLSGNLNEALHNHGIPLFMKPRYGAGSVSSYLINNQDAVDAISSNENEEFILQPFIDGTEYGVNAYVDFVSGEFIEFFVLKKIRMRSGETEKSISVHNSEIKRIISTIFNIFPVAGPIDIDIIEKDKVYYVLEINPRFGGAYPHTHEGGINFVKLIANNARGRRNGSFDMIYEEGIVAFRYMNIFTMREEDLPYEK